MVATEKQVKSSGGLVFLIDRSTRAASAEIFAGEEIRNLRVNFEITKEDRNGAGQDYTVKFAIKSGILKPDDGKELVISVERNPDPFGRSGNSVSRVQLINGGAVELSDVDRSNSYSWSINNNASATNLLRMVVEGMKGAFEKRMVLLSDADKSLQEEAKRSANMLAKLSTLIRAEPTELIGRE